MLRHRTRNRLLPARLLALLLIPLVVGRADAYRGTLSGEEDSFWTKDEMSVILAVVSDVTPDDQFGYEFHGTFVPKATLSGTFDCGLHPTLQARFWTSPTGAGSTKETPKAGDVIMALVGPVEGRYAVPVDVCLFMPDYTAMVKVTGADDPKVAETLKRIQAARLKGDPSTRPAATQPASTHPASTQPARR